MKKKDEEEKSKHKKRKMMMEILAKQAQKQFSRQQKLMFINQKSPQMLAIANSYNPTTTTRELDI
jgi:hypothetical protein